MLPENRQKVKLPGYMGVMFAHDRVKIHGYRRLLTDLGTYTPETFIRELKDRFDVKKYGPVDGKGYNIPPTMNNPEKFHVFHLYLSRHWYECARPVDGTASPLTTLDVAILQNEVFETMLGITDPRGDARLQYLGGARPVSDIEVLESHCARAHHEPVVAVFGAEDPGQQYDALDARQAAHADLSHRRKTWM